MTTTPATSRTGRDEPVAERGGFFRTYRPGKGFWTRLGTGIGAGLVILFTVQWLYRRLPAWTELSSRDTTLFAILAGLTLVLAVLAWWLINRPKHADFLIETDEEMKKVTWPTWQELRGSTKVVVAFMFFTAFVLFAYDQVFGLIFWAADVLKILPPVFEPIFGG